MKQVVIYFLTFLLALSVQAHPQMTASDVTITVNGNKSLQLFVDGKENNLISDAAKNRQTTITINNLETGQHTLLFLRTNGTMNSSERINAIFHLRYGFDMLIRLNGNGSLELIETKKIDMVENHVPMNSTSFNNLYRNVGNQRSTNGRRTVIKNAFNTDNNYFTTNQVSQLLRLVNAENFRLELAKLSYPIITDRNNFNQLYTLLNSQASRNELEDYANNYMDDEEEESEANVAMLDANFTTLYQTIQQQWPVSTQMSTLTNAFNNTNNYFSTYQASRLIQIINTENNRLQLAKLSYRSIIDRNNFSQIYSLFGSQSSKNELTTYVNNYNENNTANNAMTDANFNYLFQSIQQQGSLSAQLNLLTNAFTSSSNYFTSYQASRLIQIVSAENNRLPLAKLSYRSIVDRNNFNQVYNVISSQSGKNELTTYVNNYNENNTANNAMTDANFNYLFQSIQQQSPLSAQLNLLTNAFTFPANYFTSYQASRLIQLVNAENNRLPLAKLSYRSIVDRNNFSQVLNLISSQSGKNELTTYVNNYTENNNSNKVMTDDNFNALFQNIQQQWPVSSQMNSLTSAFNNTNYYFASSQARRLIQLVTDENNRLQLAKLSFRSIIDPANFSQVADLLNTQSGKNELATYVNNYNGGSIVYKVPMSDVNFSNFYQTLQSQFLPGEQMSSLTEAFNNQSYYFTTAQVKQLIPLVSYESNRLQLAKLSYRTITDRNNFNQLYDLLNSQASRDELTAYVNGYKD